MGGEVGCRPIDGETTMGADNAGDNAGGNAGGNAGDNAGDNAGERPTETPFALSRWSAMLANA